MFPTNGDGRPRHVHARPARRMRYPELSPAELFRRHIEEDQQNAEGPESWPAWTDVPIEHVDYGSFDDNGNPISPGGPSS